LKPNPFSPVTREVFANLFSSVAEEMGSALCHAALSPNIKERRDFSCIICDRTGAMVAQAAHIPVHLGSAPLSVQEVLSSVSMRRGDVVVLNDPFRGGTHLPDLTMVAPAFLTETAEQPYFFVANRAHHADVGGMSPGSMPVSDEIFQEGIILPPVRLVREGRMDEDLLSLILANVRTPQERAGDIQAQLAAVNVGIRRLGEIAERYHPEEMLLYSSALMDYAEQMIRHVLSSIPDGSYVGEDFLDGDGFSPDPIPLKVKMTIRGDQAVVDFSECPDQVRGNLNATLAITVSAVLYVFRLILPAEIPANAGTLRPLKVIARPGSIVSAVPPAAVAAGNVETSQRIVDILLRALAEALPDLIPAASQGTMNNVTIGTARADPDQSFAYYETTGGGAGASAAGDGASGVHTHMTNTMNTPIEALEASYPLRVERFEIRKGSGGGGRHKGGEGIRRDIRILQPAIATIISERRELTPYGLQGGQPGSPGRNILIRPDGSSQQLPGKVSLRCEPGDVVSISTPGGGGWGTEEDG
jgi:N-methylhydantoinase B